MQIKMMKIKKNIGIIIIAIILTTTLLAILMLNKMSPGEKNAGTYSLKPHKVSIETTQLDTGWGYNIYIDTSIFIVQNTIPGIEGNIPFKSEDDAKATGELALKKLKSGKTPAIFKYELDSLKVEY
jgi:hypothetical protein